MTTVDSRTTDLAGVVAKVARAHGYEEVVTVEDEGEPVAVVMSFREYDSLMETLDVLSNPGEVDDIQASRAELARGEGIDGPPALAPFLSRPRQG